MDTLLADGNKKLKPGRSQALKEISYGKVLDYAKTFSFLVIPDFRLLALFL